MRLIEKLMNFLSLYDELKYTLSCPNVIKTDCRHVTKISYLTCVCEGVYTLT